MKIGLIGALQQEIDLLKKDVVIEKIETIGMREYYIGKLYGQEVVMVFSRCGKVAAAATVTTLIERFHVDMILFTGVAGAANLDLQVGDIVIGDSLIQHDMDVSAIFDIDKYDIPLLGRSTFLADASLVEIARKSAQSYLNNEMKQEIDEELLREFSIGMPQIAIGTIASGDQFIADKQKITNLNKRIENLKCVEMEGAAAAQVCYEYGVKLLMFRILSDKADEFADINFDKFVEKTATIFTRGIIRHIFEEIDQEGEWMHTPIVRA